MPLPYRICFVCTGNICRSPMAEWVFRRYLAKAGLSDLVAVDSAGTGGWHAGQEADLRAARALAARGYDCDHLARQFDAAWFAERDLVIALDASHLRALRRLAPDPATAARIRLLRSFDPAAGPAAGPAAAGPAAAAGSAAAGAGGAITDLDVPDPYYDGAAEFERCLDLVEAACLGLLDHVSAAVRADPGAHRR